ncbi:unnamed protein product [Auanema sp. JU1783]|nr:unnamed protein product [Auanema sp. JU1783]
MRVFRVPSTTETKMLPTPSTSQKENDERLQTLKAAVAQENERIDGIAKEKLSQIKEFEALIERLNELPKKLQHHVMVPLGGVGYMPGKIVRTNEVMVLVGDGYFVEKSTYDAAIFLNKQIDMIKKVLSDIETEKKLINDQLGFAERLFGDNRGEEVEIREDYDEEAEAEFKRNREKRRAISSLKPPSDTKAGYKDLMSRLDELELNESENKELDESTQFTPPPGISQNDYNKLIARLDDDTDSLDDEDEEEYDDYEIDSDDIPEETVEEPQKVKKLNLPKKLIQERRGVRFADEGENWSKKSAGPSLEVHEKQSFGLSEGSASILRNTKPGPIDEKGLEEIQKREQPRVFEASGSAFSGVFVERQGPVAPSVSSQLDTEPSTSSEPPKRISKFKAQRSHR